MHWGHADLMACPDDYIEVLIGMINDEALIRKAQMR